MGLKIAIENPQHTEHQEAWLALGIHDPTRLSRDHEWNLLQDLGRQGAQMALVFLDDKPVLRFMMHEFLPDEGTACLGFFAIDPEAQDSLLQEGFQLSLQRMISPRMKKLVGPMNGSTWFTYRMRIDDHPLQFDWEPKAQPRLETLLRTAGFTAWAHYHSTASLGRNAMMTSMQKDYERVLERGYTLRSVTMDDLKNGALFDLHRLSQIGFAGNPLFAPLDFEVFARSYLQGKTTRENHLAMAYDASGRAVAFTLTFLEPAHLGEPRKTWVIKTIATDPEYRRQGLSNALLHAIARDLPADVSDTYMSVLIFQGCSSESLARHGQTLWQHQYVLMAKDLG